MLQHTLSTHCGWGGSNANNKRTYSVLSAQQLARRASQPGARHAPPPLRVRASSVCSHNPSPPADSPQHAPLLLPSALVSKLPADTALSKPDVISRIRVKSICFRSVSIDTTASSLNGETPDVAPDIVRHVGTPQRPRQSRWQRSQVPGTVKTTTL